MHTLRSLRNPFMSMLCESRANNRGPVARAMFVLMLALVSVVASPAAQAQSAAAANHPSRAFWQEHQATPPQFSASGARPSLQPHRFRATKLNRGAITAMVATAPGERSKAARQQPLVISLPDPNGQFQRFAIANSPVMEPGLAAKHPEIKTFAGKGIDNPAATIRMDITPLGLHASIRSPQGSWYIDPYYHLDDSVYASYYGRDLPNPHGTFIEAPSSEPEISVTRGFYHAVDTVEMLGIGFAAGATVTITIQDVPDKLAPRQITAMANQNGTVSASFIADPDGILGTNEVIASDGNFSATTTYQVVSAEDQSADPPVGDQLRTYRLALVTDPSYTTYFGGPANVTAAKVTLINRVTQVYNDETSIHLMLVANNDLLNLNTAALATGANGPCGGSACYTTAQLQSCSSGTLARNRIVLGLLIGASNYDVGHLALGVNGGGIASLGVIGGNNKAQGCTGLPTPIGDFFAVDYVAHEMGHQFAGNHTFNGTISNCSGGNRNAATSVEPGSGSSIMAYAGICGTDNLQPHSDPYWSQRSFDEIVTYTSAAETNINEVQMAALTNYTTDGMSFQLRYNGSNSATIVRGVNFTTAGIKAAIEAIAGWPVGGTVTISALGDTAFTITFGGTLAGVDVAQLQLLNCTGGCTGYIGEIAKGGPTTRNGTVTATGNNYPTVTAPASYTIPVQTPFVLTGTATDPDGDTVTYMWEQNDRAAATGTGLISNTKLNGPLFRQFGTQAVVSATDTLLYNSPGENHVTTSPTRVFPDMAQILANNTNAETGACPTASSTPTATQIDCFSEFLPTPAYVGFAGTNASPLSLHFRLTARDGRGGVNNAATTLLLATGAGPFLVTSPNTAVILDKGSTQTITWNVANTNVAPVSTANVMISLSVDGGNTYPYTLAANTPNTGSKSVTLPNVFTTAARVKVEAIDNIFFDVSNADFTIKPAGDLNIDGLVDCVDLNIVKASMGKRINQPGFDPRADVNRDGVVDVRDLSYVAQRVPVGTTCP